MQRIGLASLSRQVLLAYGGWMAFGLILALTTMASLHRGLEAPAGPAARQQFLLAVVSASLVSLLIGAAIAAKLAAVHARRRQRAGGEMLAGILAPAMSAAEARGLHDGVPHAGRPRVRSHSGLRQPSEGELREALALREFEIYFQPLVQIEPRRVAGFEALLRWNHPVLGLVMPSHFIPAAEALDLIAEIGSWVLRAACLEASHWHRDLRVSVNLSPAQFGRPDLYDMVADALRDSGLDPERLELEVTESMVMRDFSEARAVIQRLRGLGVRVTLDDFGTGYSSLSYLRVFSFDRVKIDGSFLADLQGDGGTILRAVLGLCRHLGLESLVEGVEDEEQLRWLRAEGCREAQGHLFSQPKPASRISEMIVKLEPLRA